MVVVARTSDPGGRIRCSREEDSSSRGEEIRRDQRISVMERRGEERRGEERRGEERRGEERRGEERRGEERRGEERRGEERRGEERRGGYTNRE
jgi:eukaryotic-like serine/threonine-protein kinase